MKAKVTQIVSILTIAVFLSISVLGIAQPPPPPPGGSNTQANKLSGGGAPIGGGLFILLGLGAAYGARKLYMARKEDLEE